MGTIETRIVDLKRVMENLNFHYRSNSGLGKMLLLVSGLKESQGNKTAAQHLLPKEDWLKTFKSVGIESIDVEELVALATIALFNDNHRDAFIETESHLSQTMSSLELKGLREPIEQKSMLTRVQAFVHNLDQKDVLGSRLRQGRANGDEMRTLKMTKQRDDRVKFRYAEEVLNVEKTERRERNSGICHQWTMGGCRYGDNCKFQHPQQQQQQQHQPVGMQPSGVCRLWTTGLHWKYPGVPSFHETKTRIYLSDAGGNCCPFRVIPLHFLVQRSFGGAWIPSERP
jgi:hypothetical protein